MLATKSHRDSYRGTVMPETNTKILVCNAGSSSLKFSLFDAEDEVLLADGGIDWLSRPARLVFRRANQPEVREELRLEKHADAVARILDDLQAGSSSALQTLEDLRAVGHRVVHGGDRYTSAVRITAEVKRTIEELTELAPLHNPASLEGINAVEQAVPKIPQVAAFDTAFHATLSEAARTYGLPRKWTREWGIRRYGFHGLSHSYCAGQAAKIIGRRGLRLVIAHLGNGASVSAVRDGVCVDIAKSQLANMLARKDPIQVHLPCGENGEVKGGWDVEAIAELTAEYRRQSNVRGYTVTSWHKRSGRPNHRLDCMVYSLAALAISRLKIDDCEIQRVGARNVGKEPEENARPLKWGARKMAVSGIPELGGVTGFGTESPDRPSGSSRRFGPVPWSGLSF
jgi:hypothetical protein